MTIVFELLQVYNSFFFKIFFKVLQNQFALMGFEQIASSKFKDSKYMLFVQLLYYNGNNNKYQIYAICILHISIKEWLMYKMQMLYNGTKILWDILERLLSNFCFAHNGPSHLVLFVVKSSFLRILLDIKDLSLLDIKKRTVFIV